MSVKLEVPNLNSDTILYNQDNINLLKKKLNGTIVLDFSKVRKFDPFAMLFFAEKVLYSKKYNEDNFKYITNLKDDIHGYAGSMGFFKYMGINYGKDINIKLTGANHIPITILNKDTIEKKVREKSTDFNVELNYISKEYAKVLTRTDGTVTKGVSYIIREILRNIFEHSGSDSATVCGQYWPSKDIVEIAIADKGLGIRNTLINNKLLNNIIIDDEKALSMSIKPGVSKISPEQAKQKRYNKHENSGFGLYMASNLCAKLGGEFKILSGKSCLTYKNNIYGIEVETFHKVIYWGTIISLQLKPSFFENYETIFDDLISTGENTAKETSYSIDEASGISKSKYYLPF